MHLGIADGLRSTRIAGKDASQTAGPGPTSLNRLRSLAGPAHLGSESAIPLPALDRRGEAIVTSLKHPMQRSVTTTWHKLSLLATRRGEVAGRWAFEPGAVRGETRTVQGALPRLVGVVPVDDAAEVRAHRRHNAFHAVDRTARL
jgi:hypothetical protein